MRPTQGGVGAYHPTSKLFMQGGVVVKSPDLCCAIIG